VPIHNFSNSPNQINIPNEMDSIIQNSDGIQQSHHLRNDDNSAEKCDINSTRLAEDVPVAFHALERTLKNYFSDITVPTNDYVRYLRIRISGASKSVLMYIQEQREGKTVFPIASLSGGTDYEVNLEKFSPSYLPMSFRYLNNKRNLVSKIFRPVPIIVTYKLSIYTESKRDMGYIKTQLLRRFNPYAEIWVNDGRLQGPVQLMSTSLTDTTELEVPFDQDDMKSAELNFKAESWIPLPEVEVPTVRGNVTVFRESTLQASQFWGRN
jgi:hypothetical protein